MCEAQVKKKKKQRYDRKTGGWLVGGYSNRNSKWKPQSWVKLKKLWKFKTTLRTEEQMRSWGTWTVTAIFRTCEYVWCLFLYKKKEKCSERRQPPTYGRVCVATPTSKCIGQSRGALYRNAPGNPITWFQPQPMCNEVCFAIKGVKNKSNPKEENAHSRIHCCVGPSKSKVQIPIHKRWPQTGRNKGLNKNPQKAKGEGL